MTLTNYWWLLIWLFAGGILLEQSPKRQEYLGQHRVERWSIGAAIVMVLPYIFWAGFRGDVADTSLYRQIFRDLVPSWTAVMDVFQAEDVKDPGFSVLTILMKLIIGNHDKLYFLLIL